MPEIIAMSCWSKGGRGEYPARYVVLDWGTKTAIRYSSHTQVDDGKTKPFYWGHFEGTLINALKIAQEAVRKNNSSYKAGNISHIPAWPNGEWIRIVKG